MRTLAVLSAVLLVSACAEEAAPEVDLPDVVAPLASGPDRAVAEIGAVDGSGLSGRVEFTDLGEAVEVRYNLEGFATGGSHGFHVHETGDCGPDSTGTPAGAAGGHLNPLASEHGAPSAAPANRHAGDLGNIDVESGRAIGTRIDSVLAFSGPTAILGKAVIVHAGEDDLASQPSGAAGARIGCGVIRDAGEMDADTTAVAGP